MKMRMMLIAICCAGIVQAAEPSIDELVARAQETPSLVFPKAQREAIRARIVRDPDAAAWWNEFHAKARKDVTKPTDLPNGVAQWYHYYSCRKCGCMLKAKSPTEHVCRSCGTVHAGWPYDSAYRFATHNGLAKRAQDLALAYQLSGEAAFADWAKAVLLAYAKVYETYPHHDRTSDTPIDISKRKRPRCGRVFPQALDEAVWLINLVSAYDGVAERLTDEEKTLVKEHLFRPAATLIRSDSFAIHNHECWHLAAYGLAGFAMGDADFVRAAVDGVYGIRRQLEKGILSDDCWFEGAWGYHFYTMKALTPFVQALVNLGMPAPRDFKRMFDSPFGQLSPTWQLPAVNDTGRKTFAPGSEADLYEAAYAWWRDPAHAWWVAAKPRRTQAYALLGTPLPPVAERRAPVFASRDYPASGMAILRGRTPGRTDAMPDNYIALDYGPHGGGHGHPDKLNLIFWGHGRLVAEDIGCIAYGNPMFWQWYRSSLAHNELVMDGLNQRRATGRCLSFTVTNGYTAVVLDAGAAYPGATVRRAVALVGDIVLDLLWADAEQSHDWEWAFHACGGLKTPVARTKIALPPRDSAKYDFGHDPDGSNAWSWTKGAQEGATDGSWSGAWTTKDGTRTVALVQTVVDGETGAAIPGRLRTAAMMAQPPPRVVGLAAARISSARHPVFGTVFLPGGETEAIRNLKVVRTPDGTLRLSADVNARAVSFAVRPDGAATSVDL